MSTSSHILFDYPAASTPHSTAMIETKLMRADAELLLDILRPLRPEEIGAQGIFTVTSDEFGKGTATLVGFSRDTVQDVQDEVRMLTISRIMGEPEVYRQETLGLAAYMKPRTTNPYFLTVVGLVFLGVFSYVLVSSIQRELGAFIIGFSIFAMVIIVPVASFLIISGLRRIPWWHRARATATAHNIPFPPSIRVWN